MKIACDSCGAKYTIADEKVSGKTVKIRCKKCGATMVIDGHAVGASAAAAISSAPAAASAELAASWMIHSGEGAQETVTAEQVVERYRNGSLDGSAYVWREGMADWKLLRDVPELFSVCVAGVGSAVPPAAASRPVESARRASSPPLSAPIDSSSEGATAAHEVSAPIAAPAPAVIEAPRGALSDLVAQSTTPSTAPQATAPLTGQRNDNSVLFSLASLSQGAPGAAPAAPGSDQSGLIDMRALAQIAPKAAPSGPKVDDIMNLSAGGLFGGGAVSPVMTQTYQAVQAPAGAAASSGGLSPKVLGLAVGGGALVVALVGGGLFFALRKGEPAPAAPVVAAEAPVAAPAATPAAAVEAPAAVAAPAPVAAAPAAPAPVAAPAKAPKAAAPAPAPSAKGGVSSSAAAAALFGPGGAASKPAPAPAPAPAPTAKAQPAATPASLESAMAAASKSSASAPAPKAAAAPAASGAPFDRGAAAAALRTVVEGVGSCRRPSGPSGDGHVTVTFRNDGAVDHVEVDRPPYQGTPVGACVASKFKLARVPAFGGAPITVGKSFSID